MRFLTTQRSSATHAACTLVRRFVFEENGQDVVEYAFGAAFIGIVGYVALNGITAAVGTTYASWLNPSTGVPSLWEPGAPS
jgi:Flp pilus assembly pilin Flp